MSFILLFQISFLILSRSKSYAEDTIHSNYLTSKAVDSELSPFESPKIRIPFDSEEGVQIFKSEKTNLKSYFLLSENFVTQDTQAYCGLASAAMVLNAFGDKIKDPVDPVYFPYKYFTQRDFLSLKCVQSIMGIERYFWFMGMSLAQLTQALNCVEGIKAEAVYWDDEFTLNRKNRHDTYISLQKKMIQQFDEGNFVIANINRPKLDEEGGGHFSPIAAYHECDETYCDGDSSELGLFLFMDVSRYKYKPMWVNGKALIDSMEDAELTGRSRGFIVVKPDPRQGGTQLFSVRAPKETVNLRGVNV